MQELLQKISQNPDLLILTVTSCVFIGFISWWHYKRDVRFDIKDIIVDTTTGKVSLYKIGQVVALWVSTWIIIHETKADRLNEWLFLSYMALWSGTNLAKSMIEKTNPKTNEVTRTSFEYAPRRPNQSEDPAPNPRTYDGNQ